MICVCMEMKDKCDGPMAKVCWDFRGAGGTEVKGSQELHCSNFALQMVDSLNDQYGKGTHFLEVLNHTQDERRANRN